MITTIHFNEQSYQADLTKPLDISIPLVDETEQTNCFYAPLFETSPVRAGDFVGSTAEGGPLNFLNLKLNPHGNGTHTECVGHIAQPADFDTDKKIVFTINQSLRRFHFFAKLATLYPTRQANGDRVILPVQMQEILQPGETEALILRTMPNDDRKMRLSYSGTNPPYIDPKAMKYLVDCGVQHLLLDLPSVDREEDGGRLLAHKAFWQYPDNGQNKVKIENIAEQNAPRRVQDFVRKNCTITELIYATNEIEDGLYLLNLQIAALEIDASPSKPILYQLKPHNS
ncbi:MAG: cyclase family protein [Bacteroidota bacterium]